MSSQLQDVATVAAPVAQKDIIFHVTADYSIAYWSSRAQDETVGRQYDSEDLTVNGDNIKVNKDLPIIAAVAYKNGDGHDEVRVFYVDATKFCLREVRRIGDENSNWSHGRVLNSKAYELNAKSGLTANVVNTGNGKTQLKVYYQRNSNRLSLSYSVLAVDNKWSLQEECFDGIQLVPSMRDTTKLLCVCFKPTSGLKRSPAAPYLGPESALRKYGPYLTLSHCWGQNANIVRRTAGGNLEIPLKNLPRTFKDAITATRRLGFTYLWIDSLCIIQGDKIDWERESVNMASIYSKGILNLAATYSSDSHEGLLERNQHHVTSCSWKQQIDPVSSRNLWGDWMQSRQVCWTFDPQSEFDELGLGRPLPLTSRGWVLQENVLSPRTVHFLPGEIIWECRELSAKESIYCRPVGQPQQFRGRFASSPETVPVTRNGPKNSLRTDSGDSGGQETTSKLMSGATSNQKPVGQLYSQWYDMVTQYSQKKT
ncbi:hypothetical protein FOVSG1_007061 [Fusarium oxysporum f. sp. vasinfectum]